MKNTSENHGFLQMDKEFSIVKEIKLKKNKQVINKCNVCSKNAKNQCSKCKNI